MSSETVYYDIVQKRFVYDTTGLELAIKDYPSITFKEQKIITWNIGRWDSNTRTFTNINLTQFSIRAWQSSVDYDFTTATAPMIRVLNANINSTQAKDGIIIVTYNADTKEFENAVDGQADGQRKVYIELKGYDGTGKLAFFSRPRLSQVYGEMQIDPGTDPIGETAANYYTKSEGDGRYLLKSERTETLGAYVVEATTDVTTGEGKGYFPSIPPSFDGMNLISARASVITPGITNKTTVQIYNVTTSVNMLSGAISIASEATKGTGIVDTSHNSVATDDLLRVDIGSVSDTPPKGLLITLEFQLPLNPI